VSSDTWKSGSDVQATFHSDPVVLGTLKADDAGAVSGTFAVPAVEPGAHTVELTGTDADGAAQTLSTAFTVTAVSPPTTVAPAGVPPAAVAGGASTGGLAFTGSSTRDILSVALLVLAVGLHLMALHRRRIAES
jgi:hypothetical protein